MSNPADNISPAGLVVSDRSPATGILELLMREVIFEAKITAKTNDSVYTVSIYEAGLTQAATHVAVKAYALTKDVYAVNATVKVRLLDASTAVIVPVTTGARFAKIESAAPMGGVYYGKTASRNASAFNPGAGGTFSLGNYYSVPSGDNDLTIVNIAEENQTTHVLTSDSKVWQFGSDAGTDSSGRTILLVNDPGFERWRI